MENTKIGGGGGVLECTCSATPFCLEWRSFSVSQVDCVLNGSRALERFVSHGSRTMYRREMPLCGFELRRIARNNSPYVRLYGHPTVVTEQRNHNQRLYPGTNSHHTKSKTNSHDRLRLHVQINLQCDSRICASGDGCCQPRSIG